MDTKLLQTWLGLPPGDWPPEPHVLLGIEEDGLHDRALALMERLRPHQLRHPELVTEGMNRLAQALIVLERATSPEANGLNLDAGLADPPTSATVLEAEVIEQVFPIVQSVAVEAPKRKRKQRPKPLTTAPVAATETAIATQAVLSADRRKSYRQLAEVRRVHRAWERLGPFLGVPSIELLTSGDVFRYLVLITECRESLKAFATWPILHGALCETIISSRVSLALYRELQREQRETVAADWALALADWNSKITSMIGALRMTKPKRTWRQRLRVTLKWFAAHPESILPGALLGLASGITLIRMLR